MEQDSSRGRPTDYKKKFCEEALELCLNGATDEELADTFGIHVATLYRWKAKHPEFREALRAGKEACDDRVERSLYHRAVGYTYDAVKIMQHDGAPLIVPHKEHVPPDIGAAKLWLTNRRPDQWREKSTVDMNVKHSVANMGDDELAAIAAGGRAGTPSKANGSQKPH